MFFKIRLLAGLGLALAGVLALRLIELPRVYAQTAAPLTYSAYTGTDAKVPPPAPALGTANTVITDPTFGSRILRVTDANTNGGESYIPADAGFTRTFNADATAIKLTDPHGFASWMDFNPSAFTVGDGSTHPVPHWITTFDARWEWSAVNPDVIYFLSGSTIGQYNKRTGVTTALGGPPNGDPVAYHVAVVGADKWICAAAGGGIQDTFVEIFCLNPANPAVSKFVNVPNKTINGVQQTTTLAWPTPAAGQTLGIHSVYGSAGGDYLGVSFHGQSWGGNGDCVFNVATGTWSFVTNADYYYSGHPSLGNGRMAIGAGSIDGRDSRGLLIRDAGDLMNSAKYLFTLQPPASCCWNDAEHNSWFNSANQPNAPVLDSRYTLTTSPWLAWMSEIVMAATDGSGTVWRFAHTHQGGGCYYGDAFAQVSNDGRWALFSSPWDGTLGTPGGFGCSSRIDTFIVELAPADSSASDTTFPSVTLTAPAGGSTVSGSVTVTAAATDNVGVAGVQFLLDGVALGPEITAAPYGVVWSTSQTPDGAHNLAARARDAAGNKTTSPPVLITVGNAPPAVVISGVNVSNVTSTSATVSWLTSAPADSQINGATSSYGSLTSLNSTMVTAHSQSLTGLTAGTPYHYQGRSRDSIGRLVTAPDATFTTSAAQSLVNGAVQWTALVNVTANGASLQKTAGCDGCEDAGAVSQQQLTSGDGYVEFMASETTTQRAIGLSTGNSGTTAAEIKFALRLQSGIVEVRESGTYRTDTTFTTGDVLRVAVTGGHVAYSKNGTVFYLSSASPQYPLLVNTSLATLGGTIANAVFTSASTSTADTTAPTVSISTPTGGTTIAGATVVTAIASDNVGVASVQFKLDGAALGAALTSSPYTLSWSTTSVANGSHSLTAEARDAAGNLKVSAPVAVNVWNVVAVPLKISNVTVTNIGDNSATVRWTTSAPADSSVEYGATASYGAATPVAATLMTVHAVTVVNLAPHTTYHFRAKSKNSTSSAASMDYMFTTAKR